MPPAFSSASARFASASGNVVMAGRTGTRAAACSSSRPSSRVLAVTVVIVRSSYSSA
jgi:hypothetical protein